MESFSYEECSIGVSGSRPTAPPDVGALDGICPTPEILYSDITGVSVYRRESDDVIDCNGGKAMACFVVSGTKENHIGGRKYVYTEGQCFVSSPSGVLPLGRRVARKALYFSRPAV